MCSSDLTMAMVVVMEIGSGTMAVVDGFFLFVWSSLYFSSREASLYLGAFTKVVPFDDTMATGTIRADQDGPAI